MAGFRDRIARLDAAVMRHLGDGVCQYLSRTGQVLADDVPVIVELDVERLPEGDALDGAIERVRTHAIQKHLLQPFDRQGAFVMDGKTWHIDGIAADDGHLVTFYVVP